MFSQQVTISGGKVIQKQDTFVLFLKFESSPIPIHCNCREKSNQNILKLDSFCVPLKDKKQSEKKSDGLDMRYGSFKLIKGVQAFQPTV